MEFCDDCGSMMKANDGVWHCTSCSEEKGREDSASYVITEEQEAEVGGEVIDAENRGLPKTSEECDECGAEEAYWYLQQTRAADESETRFFICTNCDNQWRGYD